jgi:thiol-disulfide isomerase/thioredoxin
MRRIFVFAAIAMLFSITAIAQQSGTSKSQKDSLEKLQIQALIQKLYAENDGQKAEIIAAEIVRNIDTNSMWEGEKAKRDLYRMHPLYPYMQSGDFEGSKNFLARLGEVNVDRIHFAKAGLARRIVAKGKETRMIDLEFAAQIMRQEREWARKMMIEAMVKGNPGRTGTYALFTMDYAKLQHLKDEKMHAFDLIKEAMEYNRGERSDPDITNYYLTVASEFIDAKDLKKEMEELIKRGMSTAEVVSRLKVIYTKEIGSEKGFENYVASFSKDHVTEKMEALRKTMLNEAAPAFRLKDLKGKEVSLKDLKGKTVVLDFWATWCGPCIASFPAMQIMVNRYKDNPNMQFLFIDTWERGENPQKDVANFIEKNKYDDFQVLLDSKSEIVEQYKIKGIPAKFVIDKNGVLRFKAAGFANDAELMNELEAMIKLVE